MRLKLTPPKPGFFAERLWIWVTGFIFSILGAGLTTLCLSLWTGFGPWLSAMIRMPEVVAQLQSDVLARQPHRVIRQIPGMSYIEAVYEDGGPMIMVAERTALVGMRLTDWTPVLGGNGSP